MEKWENEKLNKLYASISDAPDFLELFHGPLDKLLKDIMKASGACYNKVYVESEKTTDAFRDLSTSIDEDNLQIVTDIKTSSQNNIDNFIDNISAKLNQIYENTKDFIP